MLFKRRDKQPIWDRIRSFLTPSKKGYRRALDYVLWRLKRIPGTPDYIARGFAIGMAVNFWPILFTHLIIGWIFCRVFRGDFIAMFIGTLFGNPWTFAVVYPMTYRIGKALLGLRPTHNPAAIDSAEEIWKQLWPVTSWDKIQLAFENILFPMMIGGFLLALPVALTCYFFLRNVINLYQTQRRKNLRLDFDTVEAELERNNPHA